MTNDRRHWWEYVPFLLALTLVLYRLQPTNGWLGHDYYHLFTRLLIGAAHFWQNSFAVPHYTPSLCGGIPFFADPQSVYFSVAQLMTFFLEPLLSVYLTVTFFYIVGYLSFLRLLRDVFGCSSKVSHACSLAFVLNGFSFAHLFVGHFTHHSYLLIPALLYFLFRPTPSPVVLRRGVAAFSLLIIYTFYSGGLHMLVLFAVAFALATPLLIYRKSKQGELWALGKTLGLSAGCILVACSGKLVAGYLFSKSFVRSPIDKSSLGVWELVSTYFWFEPESTPLYIRFGRLAFGPWEFVGFTTKLVIPVLAAGALLTLWRGDRARRLLVLIYAILVPYLFFLAAGRGGNELLPFFKSYHNPIKILGAFIPFFILAMALTFQHATPLMRFSGERWRVAVFAIFALILLGEFRVYSEFHLTNPLVLGYQHAPEAYQELKTRGAIQPIDSTVSAHGTDLTGLRTGCSSLKCYEPLFGYKGEKLLTQLTAGNTATLREGRFNMNHPGCLVYPNYFGCKPWDRIEESDRANFEKFIAGSLPSWGVPPWQSALIRVNFVFIALLGAYLVGMPLGRLRGMFSRRLQPAEASA